MIVAKRAHAYPQVEPGVDALPDAGLAALPRGVSVRDALGLARRRDAAVLVLPGRSGFVLREDLARADGLGLADIPAADVGRPLPVVESGATEVAVRRRLAAGAAAVVVRDRRGPRRAVVAPAEKVGAHGPSLVRELARGAAPSLRALVETLAAVAAARGARAFLVGGIVRELLRQAAVAPRDIDVVIEGDAPAVARELTAAVGGRVVEHDRFLTASVEGTPHGRIDLATARFERYDAPGALPRVVPASLAADLRRRDFSVNAMALALETADAWLVDPLGGRADLARRRLRVLHPLSFVEDPTRLFRAARYAARLGFAEDAWTARCRALAVRRAPYPALSGQRLVAELALILDDARPEVALARLGRAGVYTVLDPRYRFTRITAARLAELPAARAWAEERALAANPVELAVLTILADQPPDVATAAVRRLAFVGEPSARLHRALGQSPELADRLARAATPSARAALLRERAPLDVAWLWLTGGAKLRPALDWFAGVRAVRAALGGDEVAALGVPRGPELARVLGELRDARLDGRVGDRAGEIEYVRRWVRQAPAQKEG